MVGLMTTTTTTHQAALATTAQPGPVRHGGRIAAALAGLAIAGLAGGYLINNMTRDDSPKATQASTALNTGGGAATVADSGLSVLFGTAAPELGPPKSGNPGLDVLFGTTAIEAGWAPIRYSSAPGLALILSERYPLT